MRCCYRGKGRAHLAPSSALMWFHHRAALVYLPASGQLLRAENTARSSREAWYLLAADEEWVSAC